MSNYSSDRNFTDYVHKHLTTPLIYKHLGWTEKEMDATELQFMDMNEGVDYIFEDKNGKTIKVQERFRDNFYQKYNDCTLRYRRDKNADLSKHESEFYKIKADYLIYGITNGSKNIHERHTLTDFIKYVIIDLTVLYDKIQKGLIVMQRGLNVSDIKQQKMIVPIKDNFDNSSSFVAFDINQLQNLFGQDKIIKNQKGYL